ncbi:5-hydroxyisourate hydrolase-like isoform X1 [Astyanax mexicanus]|uniref:5-hydroxyisourate hydrolase n=2 Tax=Astyanax mexicanus TaxID=7994 RepID=A0A8T2MBC0_ASTMX|nr:5-hydroxyisourate hydrolase-like isoform X1 [Astyanax mexicanus]
MFNNLMHTSCLHIISCVADHSMTTSKTGSLLTTHVLNTADGVPGARMALSLHRLDPQMALWNLVSIGTTDEDGQCSDLISRDEFTAGMYKLRFETRQYWESLCQSSFYPYIEIVFTITDLDQTFHLPLLLSRYSYSTYKGI